MSARATPSLAVLALLAGAIGGFAGAMFSAGGSDDADETGSAATAIAITRLQDRVDTLAARLEQRLDELALHTAPDTTPLLPDDVADSAEPGIADATPRFDDVLTEIEALAGAVAALRERLGFLPELDGRVRGFAARTRLLSMHELLPDELARQVFADEDLEPARRHLMSELLLHDARYLLERFGTPTDAGSNDDTVYWEYCWDEAGDTWCLLIEITGGVVVNVDLS